MCETDEDSIVRRPALLAGSSAAKRDRMKWRRVMVGDLKADRPEVVRSMDAVHA